MKNSGREKKMPTKLDEKFLMLEFSNVKFPNIDNLYNGYFINQHYKKFDNLGLITIGNYIADSNCAYSSTEMENGYLIHLYFLPNNFYEYQKIREVILHSEFEHDNFLLEKKDILNIFKYFIVETLTQHHILINGKGNELNPPIIFKDRSVVFTQLFFYKNKFSNEEMVYWSNVCLKLFVLFHKTLLTKSKNLLNTALMLSMDKFKQQITEKIIDFYKYKPLYFFIDASMEYHQIKRDINKEICKKML